MIYRRRPSPLHAAAAPAGCAYCAALAVVALMSSHPLVLAADLVAVAGAARLAGVAEAMRRASRLAIPLAVAMVVINALVSRNGLTVIARLGELPIAGRLDVTLEAVAWGAIQGLRLGLVIMAGALYSASVDPDEVLRMLRRVSFRSALSATLATRMVPVLARDARRMAEAQRCLPGRPAPRVALLRAVTAGALDRSLDVAAALEGRGYGALRRPPRERRSPSRHDLAFGAAAVGLVVLVAAARLGGVGRFSADQALALSMGAPEVALAVALVVLALAPFADRRGIVR